MWGCLNNVKTILSGFPHFFSSFLGVKVLNFIKDNSIIIMTVIFIILIYIKFLI